jgi:hypothetical protein
LDIFKIGLMNYWLASNLGSPDLCLPGLQVWAIYQYPALFPSFNPSSGSWLSDSVSLESLGLSLKSESHQHVPVLVPLSQRGAWQGMDGLFPIRTESPSRFVSLGCPALYPHPWACCKQKKPYLC